MKLKKFAIKTVWLLTEAYTKIARKNVSDAIHREKRMGVRALAVEVYFIEKVFDVF